MLFITEYLMLAVSHWSSQVQIFQSFPSKDYIHAPNFYTTPHLYVTVKLRNQAFREMPKNFSHFLK